MSRQPQMRAAEPGTRDSCSCFEVSPAKITFGRHRSTPEHLFIEARKRPPVTGNQIRMRVTNKHWLSAFCPLPFAFCLLPFAFCLLPFALCLLPFAFCPLPYAFCPLPYAFCLLPFNFQLSTFNFRSSSRPARFSTAPS